MNSLYFFPFAIFAFFLISNPIHSQTFFKQHTLTVSPANPTTNDTIYIYVAGDKSSTDIYLAGSSVSLFGTNVNISFHWNSSGIGLLVLVPWDSTFKVGPLAAGNYTVVLSGTYMNSTVNNVPFTVTGSGIPQCTDIEVVGNRKICTGDTAYLDIDWLVAPVPPGWSYLWSNGVTTTSNPVFPLNSTLYSVTASNAGTTCVLDAFVEVSFMDISLDVIHPICYGDSGTVSVSVANGFAPYIFDWDNLGLQDSVVFDVPSGTHYFEVWDSLGCLIWWFATVDDGEQVLTSSIVGDTYIDAINFTTTYYVDDSTGSPGSGYHWGSLPDWYVDIISGQGTAMIEAAFILGISDTVMMFVIETDSNNCIGDTVWLTVVVDIPIGVETPGFINELSISPNPVSQNELVRLPYPSNFWEIRVYNVLGEIERNEILQNHQAIYYPKLKPGIYIIELQNQELIKRCKLMVVE